MKALIFDLDGTLVDSVYAHVLAWQLSFAEAGMPTAGVCICILGLLPAVTIQGL